MKLREHESLAKKTVHWLLLFGIFSSCSGAAQEQGLSCPHSAVMAVSWYRKAADPGNAIGENNLADMYLKGEGVPQNNAEAFRWFEKAAIEGSTGARIKLGYLYANGLGVKKDPETAYAWISAASMAGDRRGDT
jgi:TPR repeat protein